MGIAKDFADSFLKDHPEAANGKMSMEELNMLMAEHQRKLNDGPLEDFDGLNPDQMTDLLYSPFSPNSMIRLKPGIDKYLDEVPIFKLAEVLLSEISAAGSLKLTPKGSLPVKICELLYSQDLIRFPYEVFLKRKIEDDIPYIWPLKLFLTTEGIVKKRNNALSLTTKGKKLMEQSKTARFTILLDFFTNRFHWANFYDLNDEGKFGHLGWAYSLLLLSRYGDVTRKGEFYSLKLFRAFERELWEQYQAGSREYETMVYFRAVDARFFESFASWFGLVKTERVRRETISPFDDLMVTRTALFDQLIEVKES